MVAVGLALAGAGLAGCSDMGGSEPKAFDAMSGEEHLACAVDISAFTYLIAAGTIAKNEEWYSQSLGALAWHHNAYAIPLGKGEQYVLINTQRDALIAKDAPETIEARAIQCIISAAAKNEAS
jgi:hypothetical protein